MIKFLRPTSLRHWAILIFIIVVCSGVIYTVAEHEEPSTNNAYVQAFVAQVAPQVAGTIVHIYVNNNSLVKKGDVLFEVDPRLYEREVVLQEAALLEAQQNVETLKAAVIEAQNGLEQHQASYAYAAKYYNDIAILERQKAVSRIDLDKALSTMQTEKALLGQAQATYEKAKSSLGPEVDGEYVPTRKAKAALEKAKIELQETKVTAPGDGYITNMSINSGNYASAGTPVLTFISKNNWWIVANIEENNLSHVRPGQSVDISLNFYPGKTFHGVVESIGYGVSLSNGAPPVYLPYIEKTANWVQLAQRFPVIIRFKDMDMHQYPLRIGSTAYVTIYTKKFGLVHIISWISHRIVSYWQFVG